MPLPKPLMEVRLLSTGCRAPTNHTQPGRRGVSCSTRHRHPISGFPFPSSSVLKTHSHLFFFSNDPRPTPQTSRPSPSPPISVNWCLWSSTPFTPTKKSFWEVSSAKSFENLSVPEPWSLNPPFLFFPSTAELVSNCSDALDKIRFQSIQE